MYSFGKQSATILDGTCFELWETATIALKLGIMDFSAICSIRSERDQTIAFNNGKSKVSWPNSKHNVLKPGDYSEAVDLVPYINNKISWDKNHCIALSGIILAVGKIQGYTIRWGGNWDLDGEPITDQDFQDLVHYEMFRG